ncbi:hypothetical protein DPMN_061721 [Dreissena polymorpha]|uniref:Uncharacterized protein n=1 Tax=Dreissena polymorpha TaxID=45954 RepID=A0A9D4HJF7_DREPO|nr:hypothetical protein DPMN_061721 [Dreissena polymorpha]
MQECERVSVWVLSECRGAHEKAEVAGTQGAPDGAAHAFRQDLPLQRALGRPGKYLAGYMLRAPEVPGAPLQGLRGQHNLPGDASYSESKASARPTHRGILQHIRLCAEFHRRTEILDRIKSFLMDESTPAPLVVHGNRGSILALSEKLSKIWLAKTPKLVLR